LSRYVIFIFCVLLSKAYFHVEEILFGSIKKASVCYMFLVQILMVVSWQQIILINKFTNIKLKIINSRNVG
jgi:hypothetical protein